MGGYWRICCVSWRMFICFACWCFRIRFNGNCCRETTCRGNGKNKETYIKGRMQEEEDDDRIPKFSEVFDLDNLEHMKYAASLFCGNTYGYVDSNVWNKYAPEDGG